MAAGDVLAILHPAFARVRISIGSPTPMQEEGVQSLVRFERFNVKVDDDEFKKRLSEEC